MRPLTKLAPDKRAIYNELNEEQQQKYWKLWQSKGPAYTHQMATLWAEGNQTARYEAGGLSSRRIHPTDYKIGERASDYVEAFLCERDKPFTFQDAVRAIRKAGSTHSESSIISGFYRTSIRFQRVGRVKRRKKTYSLYEVVGGAV